MRYLLLSAVFVLSLGSAVWAGDKDLALTAAVSMEDAIKAAGYRVVRCRDWIDWGAGERHAESVLIADPTAIWDREVLPLPDRNFQFPDGRNVNQQRAGLVCPHCSESRGEVVTLNENHLTFRCDGCGYRLDRRADRSTRRGQVESREPRRSWFSRF